MAKDKSYTRIFLTVIIVLVFGSFGFTVLASTWIEGKKLDKSIYNEHKEAQDAAFEAVNDKMDTGFKGLKEGVDALLSREIEALQKAAARK